MTQPLTKGVVSGGKERRQGQRRQGKEVVMVSSIYGKVYNNKDPELNWDWLDLPDDRRTAKERRRDG